MAGGFWRGIGLSNADRVRVIDLLALGADLEAALAQADADADRAELARDAAVLNSGLYQTVTAGMAATAVGEYFSIPTDDEAVALVTYRHDATGAVAVARFAGSVSSGQLDRSAMPLTDMSRLSVWGASDTKGMEPHLEEMADEFGAAFYGGSNIGATLDSIWHEQGSRPMQVQFPGDVIPASGTAVQVEWLNGFNRNAIRARPCTVEGTGIECSADGTTAGMMVTRSGVIDGFSQPVQLGGPVRLLSRHGAEWSGGFQIWCVGRNNIAYAADYDRTPYELITEAVLSAWRWLPTQDRRVLVLGHTTLRDTTTGSPDRAIIAALNSFYRETFGERFIDIQSYMLSDQIWTDTGLTPTANDELDRTYERMPSSLAADASHFNDTANRAIVFNLIRPRLIQLGWYSEAIV